MLLQQNDSKRQLISLVIPVYNEEQNIERCHQELSKIIDALNDYAFEFVFTDNCSTDNSYTILKKLAATDPRVRAFSFSRNYGYQRSIYTGLSLAQGNAAVVFDCDLQDPPELLPEFIRNWRLGYHVVYGVRMKRKEGQIITFVRKCFYRLINMLSETSLPLDSGDFRLIDRRILNILKSIPEQQPYLRGIIASLGFRQVGVPYARNKRMAGKSKFNLASLVSLAIDGIVSHSVIPLKIPTYIGLTTSAITAILIIVLVSTKLWFNVNWPPGFTTITILLLFIISLNALFFGIIGEYLARMYKQVLSRPITIIEHSTED